LNKLTFIASREAGGHHGRGKELFFLGDQVDCVTVAYGVCCHLTLHMKQQLVAQYGMCKLS